MLCVLKRPPLIQLSLTRSFPEPGNVDVGRKYLSIVSPVSDSLSRAYDMRAAAPLIFGVCKKYSGRGGGQLSLEYICITTCEGLCTNGGKVSKGRVNRVRCVAHY